MRMRMDERRVGRCQVRSRLRVDLLNRGSNQTHTHTLCGPTAHPLALRCAFHLSGRLKATETRPSSVSCQLPMILHMLIILPRQKTWSLIQVFPSSLKVDSLQLLHCDYSLIPHAHTFSQRQVSAPNAIASSDNSRNRSFFSKLSDFFLAISPGSVTFRARSLSSPLRSKAETFFDAQTSTLKIEIFVRLLLFKH